MSVELFEDNHCEKAECFRLYSNQVAFMRLSGGNSVEHTGRKLSSIPSFSPFRPSSNLIYMKKLRIVIEPTCGVF